MESKAPTGGAPVRPTTCLAGGRRRRSHLLLLEGINRIKAERNETSFLDIWPSRQIQLELYPPTASTSRHSNASFYNSTSPFDSRRPCQIKDFTLNNALGLVWFGFALLWFALVWSAPSSSFTHGRQRGVTILHLCVTPNIPLFSFLPKHKQRAEGLSCLQASEPRSLHLDVIYSSA